MSPASQGGLEVERYIGTCLFSTHTRAGAGPAAKAAAAAVAAAGGGGGPANAPQGLSKTRAKGPAAGVYPFGPRYGRTNGTPPQPSPPPPWAGLPLISLAAAQHRRPAGGASAPADDGLAQLAMRTQGAPLILAGRYHHHHHHSHHHNHHNHTPSMGGGRPTPHHPTRQRPSAHRPLAATPRHNSNVPGVAQTAVAKDGKTAAGDNLSVASDESSGGHSSENSLPRIIKPRKRRKKDRKPPATTTTSVSTSDSPPQSPPPQSPSPPPSSGVEPARESKGSSSVSVSDPEPPKPAIGAARAPGSATGPIPVPAALDGEGDTCSSCQCRYCDPAGRVWAALPAGASPLRRSWSEPSPPPTPPSPIPSSPATLEDCDGGALQVSTHIVTSLHGHRDLEIRFFSSSPPQRPAPAPPLSASPCASPWGAPPSPPPHSPSPPASNFTATKEAPREVDSNVPEE